MGRSRRRPSVSFSVLHRRSISAIEPFFPIALNLCFTPSRRSFLRKTPPVKQAPRSDTKCAGCPRFFAALDTKRVISGDDGSFVNTLAESGMRENASKTTPTLNVTSPNIPFTSVRSTIPVSYTHLRAHETRHDLVCRLLLEKKKK